MTAVIGAPEAAWLLRAILEKRDWRFSLTEDGRLHVTIGDTPPKLSQSAVLAMLGALEGELVRHLRVGTVQ
jgi:hypothetical protein